jgi:hypothetical protein
MTDAVRLTWDIVKTLGTLTSDTATMRAAFVGTRAFRIAAASFNACCVEERQCRAVRTEAGLHVVGRQTSVYTLEQRILVHLALGSLATCTPQRSKYTSHVTVVRAYGLNSNRRPPLCDAQWRWAGLSLSNHTLWYVITTWMFLNVWSSRTGSWSSS